MQTLDKLISHILLISLMLIISTVSCMPSGSVQKSVPLPNPDPIDVSGDDLYAIYRKGLITRHIAGNGRLLEVVALESIDEFDEQYYDGSGYIEVKRTDGSLMNRIPVDNIRYSEEIVPDMNVSPPNTSEKLLWVPVVAPIKNPGLGNDGYYVVSGGGDNPLYYGGMALATFSLEHIHDVSPYSIVYARKLVEYFLASEMTGQNGYMVRRPNHFDSNRSRYGEPIIQGASSEELLGTMLGLMYYLRAEDHTYPLYAEAKALQSRILDKVSKGHITDRYEHKFMKSREDWSYWVKPFEFPMYASAGRIGSELARELYINPLTLAAGGTRTFGEIVDDTNFFDYPMFLTSMILILDSDIPDREKEWFAEVFMRDFIKAANTNGPDRCDLGGNAYMGVVAKLANKYLNNGRDSEFEGAKLRQIWGDGSDTVCDGIRTGTDWYSLMASVEIKIVNASSEHNRDWAFWDYSNRLMWQHNLPLWRPGTDGDRSLVNSLWQEHNPHDRIGGWFVWGHRWPFRFEKPIGRWSATFPGWADGKPLDEVEYMSGQAQKYTKTGYLEEPDKFRSGFLDREIRDKRGHRDNQVEGAGLGLLFPRMLLTQINPKAFPPPSLPESYNQSYSVLPWPGVTPYGPQFLQHQYEFNSKDNPIVSSFQIEGDRDKALRIVSLGDELSPSANFVVAYATDDERLKLMPGFVTDGYKYPDGKTLAPGIYVSESGSDTRGRFDFAEMVTTRDESENEYIVVAERAEEASINSWCRDHWLRLSLWRASSTTEGYAGSVSRLDKWVDPDEDCDAVPNLDIVMMNQAHVAVLFETKDYHPRLRLFRIDFSAGKLIPITNSDVSGDTTQYASVATSAYGNVIVAPIAETDGSAIRFFLTSQKWNGQQFEAVSKILIPNMTFSWESVAHGFSANEILDVVTIRRLDLSQPNNTAAYFVLLAGVKDGYLVLYSWEAKSNGSLDYKGAFDTHYAADYLLGPELGWERASLAPLYWQNDSGFVLVGKGVARTVMTKDGSWKMSDGRGLKVIYGQIDEKGLPTIASSNVIGSGEEDALEMLDVTGSVSMPGHFGVVTAHKTYDDYLSLNFWECMDDFRNFRWSNQ